MGMPTWTNKGGDAPGASGISGTATTDGYITMVGRRRFLLLGLGGGAAALVGGTSARVAAEVPTAVSVWRVVGRLGIRSATEEPHTRCRCQSCRNHAANKVFLSKAVALANRIHPCCVCQPYSVELLAADAATRSRATRPPRGRPDLRGGVVIGPDASPWEHRQPIRFGRVDLSRRQTPLQIQAAN